MTPEREREWAEKFAVATGLKPHVPPVLQTLLAAFAKEVREDCALDVRAACEACGGSGIGSSTSRAEHDCGGDGSLCAVRCPVEVEEQAECEYCGRPMAAIRAREKGNQ